ncbi:MAG: hypothetical protein ACLFRG_02865 [Desulfococcaceae bacterium]
MKRGIPPLLSLLLLTLTACQSPPPASPTVTVPPGMERFLMVSFINVGDTVGPDQGVRSPLSGQVFVTGEVAEDAERLLTDLALERLRERTPVKLITADQARDLQTITLAISNPDVSERALLMETGRRLNADGVFVGHVYRYRNRVGGKFAATDPASVAFDLFLMRISDGRVLWSAFFDETQKALTDDLFQLGAFLERDGQWITADQMAAKAMERMMETLRIP